MGSELELTSWMSWELLWGFMSVLKLTVMIIQPCEYTKNS